MSTPHTDVQIAERILRGETVKIEEIVGRSPAAGDERSLDEYASALLRLATRLKKESEFGYARQILGWARKVAVTDPKLRTKLRQQHALCTYKDLGLRAADRFDMALEILRGEESLESTRDQETLGLAGAIYKRKWEVSGQKQDLETSLHYYLRGYQEGSKNDRGYTGGNAAFILDLLSRQERLDVSAPGKGDHKEDSRQLSAKLIREDLVQTLPGMAESDPDLQKDWWIHVTIAEAYFGLREYDKALDWLNRAKKLNPEPWQYEAAAIQLGSLANLQSGRSPRAAPARAAAEEKSEQSGDLRAWEVLREFLGEDAEGLLKTARVGKVGLSLSGGGFRAALFHVGVLARLAELDVLRSVEVISCVSGGAIVGALYYLEVRSLLQAKPDGSIGADDYIRIVQRIERNLLRGAQRNLRMRGVANLFANLRSVFGRDYSRSERLGDLLEDNIFAWVDSPGTSRRRNRDGHYLDELTIEPRGERAEKFSPPRDNWRRVAKVPVLVIHATTLNTGHDWQFTTSCMGEPTLQASPEHNKCARLPPVRYADAPDKLKKFPLGRAVAASNCLPGLFEPIVLPGLYEGLSVRLADGSAQGNPGIHGLLERDCTVMLVSSGAGHLQTLKAPPSGPFTVPLRSGLISMTQLRQAQYDDLLERRRSLLLRGLMYVHLLKDLEEDTVEPALGCAGPRAERGACAGESLGALTSYGIRRDVQRQLSTIRTDLDTFSDVEAYALMTSGYRMTEYEFARSVEGFAPPQSATLWRFLCIEEPLKRLGSAKLISGMVGLLAAASDRGFKVWRLSRAAQVVALMLGFTVILGLLLLSQKWWGASLRVSVKGIALAVVSVLLLLLLGKVFLVVRKIPKTLTEIAIDLGMAFFGWLAANLYLLVLDPMYLSLGRVRLTEKFKTMVETQASEIDSTQSGHVPAAKTIGERIQESKPGRLVAKILDQSDPTTRKFVDRLFPVDVIGKLFEAAGYNVFRFPRTPELNPLQINLDLVLQQGGRYICAEIKTAGDQTGAVDWTAALELQTASRALQGVSERQALSARRPGEQPLPLATEVSALLVLVNVEPTEALKAFGQENIQTVMCTSQVLNDVQARADEIMRSPELGEEGRRREIQSLLEKLLGVKSQERLPVASGT